MNAQLLNQCPTCHYPLPASAGRQTGITCSRCNTWVELETACLSSCLRCHNARSANQDKCATPVTATGCDGVIIKNSNENAQSEAGPGALPNTPEWLMQQAAQLKQWKSGGAAGGCNGAMTDMPAGSTNTVQSSTNNGGKKVIMPLVAALKTALRKIL